METYIVKVNGKTYEVEVEKQGEQAVQSIEPVKNSSPSKMPSGQEVTCGTSGKIWKVVQTEGAQDEKGRHHHDLGGHEDGNSDRLSL